jgi:predicted nucleotide-binding protein
VSDYNRSDLIFTKEMLLDGLLQRTPLRNEGEYSQSQTNARKVHAPPTARPPSMIPKPRLFIGSSTEGIDAAWALQENLERDADVHVWDQGAFELSGYTLSSLLDQVDQGDFAAFIFAPDDVLALRGNVYSSVRDNVLLETGMFLGRLGRQRAFLVIPRDDDLRMPTDLLGLTTASYDPSSSRGLRAAMGPAANRVRQAMRAAAPMPRFLSRHELRVPSHLHPDRLLMPYLVPHVQPPALQQLSWEQFSQGIELLVAQIRNYGSHINADVCVGVNDAGLAMASFLNSACLDLADVGYVRTRSTKAGMKILPSSFLPTLATPPSVIMICDFEVKSGAGLDVLVRHLRSHFGDCEFYVAVFGALTDTPVAASVDDLVAGALIQELDLTMFIACTMPWPGIEPPLQLR